MPYRDHQRKREWEQRHRTHRVARRRELRRIEAARQAAQPAPPEAGISGAARKRQFKRYSEVTAKVLAKQSGNLKC